VTVLVAQETRCSRCDARCDRGPWKEQLCNRCALELGEQDVAARQGPVQTSAKSEGTP
jgi:hypothetical protein